MRPPVEGKAAPPLIKGKAAAAAPTRPPQVGNMSEAQTHPADGKTAAIPTAIPVEGEAVVAPIKPTPVEEAKA